MKIALSFEHIMPKKTATCSGKEVHETEIHGKPICTSLKMGYQHVKDVFISKVLHLK